MRLVLISDVGAEIASSETNAAELVYARANPHHAQVMIHDLLLSCIEKEDD